MKRISAIYFLLFWFLFLFGCMKPVVPTAQIISKGTQGEFNFPSEELRNIIYSIDSIPCYNNRCTLSVTPGTGDDINLDLTITTGPYKGFSSNCKIQFLPAISGNYGRTRVKVLCTEDMIFVGDFANSEKNILAAVTNVVAKMKLNKASVTPVVTEKEVVESIKTDIDEIPSLRGKPNRGAYAIIIGIEKYRQKLPNVNFAASDAKLVRDYLSKVMGYPEENIITLINENASNVDLAKYFEQWLSNNVEKGGTVFVYYSGHGAPNPQTGDAYLVPYDGDPAFIEKTGYSLKRMYEALGKLPAKEIIIALDSCFSGAGGRSVIAKGARPLVMNLQSSTPLPKNMTVLSASSGEQISSTYDEKGHGLFTYFLLKGIKNEDVVNPDGSIKMDDLFGYLRPQVERIARKQYNNEQSPQLIGQKATLKE